jgi:hypothetical protein
MNTGGNNDWEMSEVYWTEQIPFDGRSFYTLPSVQRDANRDLKPAVVPVPATAKMRSAVQSSPAELFDDLLDISPNGEFDAGVNQARECALSALPLPKKPLKCHFPLCSGQATSESDFERHMREKHTLKADLKVSLG